MTFSFLETLDLDLRNDPLLVAGPPAQSEIVAIETFAGFALPEDYRAFVQRYGAAIVGSLSIYGIGASEAMGEEEKSVIRMTERFRADGWPGTATALVISMDLAGNAITLCEDGTVNRFDHDSGVSEVFAKSFSELVQKLLASTNPA